MLTGDLYELAFYEEQNPKDISFNEVKQAVREFIPKIQKSDIKFLYHGSYNVFEVSGKFIFRIPDIHLRNQIGIQLIENEIQTLNILKEILTIPIPVPIFISLKKDFPLMGYKMIPGISLSRCFANLPSNCRQKLARRIGNFLTLLHSPKTLSRYNETVVTDLLNFQTQYQNVWKNELKKIKSLILHRLDDNQREWTLAIYNKFLPQIEKFSFKPVITHGDFDITNILINPDSCKLTGIIDFEDTKPFDPAVDLLFYREGKGFQEEIINNYEHKLDKYFDERRQFYYSRSCFPYMIFGLENNIPSLVNAGFELLAERMKRFPLS
jgi:aminoglycoside 2''-phosphotransferase